MKIVVLHGPNLNLLGQREPELYGATTLQQIDQQIKALGKELQASIEIKQSNHEGELIDWIQQAKGASGFLLNAGALTHTSLALADALRGQELPFVEVHISNTYAREEIRHHSFTAPHAAGVVIGFGPESYLLGLRGLIAQIQASGKN